MAGQKRRVLVLDNDRDIAELVHAVLTDAGFEISELTDLRSDAIRIAVGQQEPDCVLLDGASSADFGESWLNAAWNANPRASDTRDHVHGRCTRSA